VGVGSNLFVGKDLTVSGTMTINAVSLSTTTNLQEVTNDGNTTTNTIEFNNPTTGLVASGNVEVGGELSVSENVELSSNLTVSGNVEVGGELSVSGNVEVGTANLFVDTTTGNVGVGATDPARAFEITRPGGDAIINLKRSDFGTGQGALAFVNGYSNVAASITCARSGSEGGEIRFYTVPNDTTQTSDNPYLIPERMRINKDGNVGIGTTNPTTKLHMYAVGSGNVMDFRMSGSWTVGDYYRILGYNADKQIQFNYNDGMWLSDNNRIRFGCGGTQGSSGLYPERMRIDSGTTVSVAGGTAGKGVSFAHAGLAIDRVWGNYPSITVMNQNSTGDTNQSQLRIHGCNVSYSSYPNISGSDFGCSVYIDGTFQNSSDRRFKTNITTIDNALDKVLSLSGKRYQILNVDGTIRTNVSTNDYKYGFIAQDLQELGLGETYIHYTDEDDGTDGYNRAYAVDYNSFIPLLVNAVKEQNVIINNIRDQLEMERDRNDTLEARILALENAS